METFSARLQREMQAVGMSRRDLAGRTGNGLSAIAKWLKGTLTPKTDQLLAISRALGVTMEWLLTGEGPKTAGEAHGAVLQRVAGEAKSQGDFDRRLGEITPLIDEINTLREGLRDLEEAARKLLDESARRTMRTKPTIYDFTGGKSRMVAHPSYKLPFVGEVAAGEKIGVEFEEEVEVRKPYPSGHFVVRVSGDSMEPELRDGDLIVVRGTDVYTPGDGKICVVSDGTGSSVKRWNRKEGLFESLNREFADLEPTEDLVFQGYYVEKIER